MTEYRILNEAEINRRLFSRFIRRQEVDLCLRRENGAWVVRSDPFIDDWSEEDYQVLLHCLKHTVSTGGFVCGAFLGRELKGFVSVEKGFFGGENNYHDLSSLYVSADVRRSGIGSALFLLAANWAKADGAKKLYISAHSAIESQSFYHAMGCTEASAYHQGHVDAEPYDCQLEYTL